MLPAETVILAGPTGAGKTDLAVRLARRIGGEIVGADAFQIYAGLPILTAQPSAQEQIEIPHHLVGSIDPRMEYDTGRYLGTALPILWDIVSRGRIPIVVGGTGLYVKALLGGLDELPTNNPTLREEFSKAELSELNLRLHSLDPEAAAHIDPKNRRRVERALEIVIMTGRPLADSWRRVQPPEGLRALLLTREREELRVRIAANVESMLLRGVEQEVASLPEEQVGKTAAATLGLKEIRALLRGEATRADTIGAIIRGSRRYAKRQLTWFRNQHDFREFNLGLYTNLDHAVDHSLKALGF